MFSIRKLEWLDWTLNSIRYLVSLFGINTI